METQRNLLTISLFAICALLYIKWIEFSNEKNAPNTTTIIESEVPGSASTSTEQPLDNTSVPIADVSQAQQTSDSKIGASLITVTTDMVVAQINTMGGTIERLELRQLKMDCLLKVINHLIT